MIGANAEVINKAEDRQLFKAAMDKIGLSVCRGEIVNNIEQARNLLNEIGLPCVVRPSFTMGGSGSSIAYNRDEFDTLVRRGIDLSPINEVLLEQSIIGWKEYEMEVMRDMDDNVVIICSIENFDAMGVHTGDSITVAPAQTLTDKEYQRMRDASLAVIREIGVETGGSNIQFAINPEDGELLDFFGGIPDLDERSLPHVGPRFADDPLRVLRGVQVAGRFDLDRVEAPAQAEQIEVA